MNYHNITKEDQNNGDGLRTVLWVSGCGHHCPGCQNPQTWDKDSGIVFESLAFKELRDSLEPSYISGLTLSGGDPLYPDNLSMIHEVCRFVKRYIPGKTIWIYTGYTFEYIMQKDTYGNDLRQAILNYCDVLVDGRYEEDKRDIDLKWRGSSNQRVIDVQETLRTGKIKLHCD